MISSVNKFTSTEKKPIVLISMKIFLALLLPQLAVAGP